MEVIAKKMTQGYIKTRIRRQYLRIPSVPNPGDNDLCKYFFYPEKELRTEKLLKRDVARKSHLSQHETKPIKAWVQGLFLQGHENNDKPSGRNEGVVMSLMQRLLTEVEAGVQSSREPGPGLKLLIGELEHYRQQSAWLLMVNELYGRLAGAMDLPGMLEAFSIWLMSRVDHDLIAYSSNDFKRVHKFCSCHGPRRRHIMDCADQVIGVPATMKQEIIGARETPGEYAFSEMQVLHIVGNGYTIFLLREGGGMEWPDGLDRNALKAILSESFARAEEYELLFRQARRDVLTGLANRRVFEERIEPVIRRARRYDEALTLMSMDLDRFKELNDTLGHAEGDRALRQVADTVAAMVRDTDLFVRMGGDEFLLVLENTDSAQAQELGLRIQTAVKEQDIRVRAGRCLGISVGLAQWRSDMSLEQWMSQADEDLYRAKRAKKEQKQEKKRCYA